MFASMSSFLKPVTPYFENSIEHPLSVGTVEWSPFIPFSLTDGNCVMPVTLVANEKTALK